MLAPVRFSRVDTAPALPTVLSGATAFLWLWAAPMVALLLLNWQGYLLIEGNLDPAERRRWQILIGAVGFSAFLAVASFGVARSLPRQAGAAGGAHRIWSGLMIAASVAYLWMATAWSDRLVPRAVPEWIFPRARLLFQQYAFAMVPLFLGIVRLAGLHPTFAWGKTLLRQLGIAVAAPLVLYLAFIALKAFGVGSSSAVIAFSMLLVVCGIALFVALCRGLLVALRIANRWGQTGERLAIFLLALVLPLIGLGMNEGIEFPVSFQSPAVYALTVANAGVLLLASFQQARWPRLRLWLLAALFPFTLYFFVVFLPYTPLSLVGLFFFGAGLLVLTPTCLFVLHVYLLTKSARSASLDGRRAGAVLIATACGLLLPAYFAFTAYADKAALNAALDHLHSPALQREAVVYEGSRLNLRRALDHHAAHKNGIYYPILSDFYSWAVFNHLVLPEAKLAQIERIFFGVPGVPGSAPESRAARNRTSRRFLRPVPQTVRVAAQQATVAAQPDGSSVVSLVLNLSNHGPEQAEYVQVLELPAGVLVAGFRLHVNGEPVPGRITDRKTAQWVYEMIRDTERRDPGILSYVGVNRLELRVFPVVKTATVEIDFLVPGRVEPGRLPVNTNRPTAVVKALGEALSWQRGDHPGGTTIAVTEEQGLSVEREPYVHLIVDRSQDSGYDGDVAAIVREAGQRFPGNRGIRVTLAHSDVVAMPGRWLGPEELAELTAGTLDRLLPRRSGFALDHALAHALWRHRVLDLDAVPGDALPPRPILVLLSNRAPASDPERLFSERWAEAVGGYELHQVRGGGEWSQVRSAPPAAPMMRLGGQARPATAQRLIHFGTASPNVPLEIWSPAEARWQPVANVHGWPRGSRWAEAVALHAKHDAYARSPGDAAAARQGLLLDSRSSGMLIPSTSYIVVENAAQWRMLERSEHQKMGQNDALDFQETPAPGIWILGLGLVFLAAVRRRGWRYQVRTEPVQTPAA